MMQCHWMPWWIELILVTAYTDELHNLMDWGEVQQATTSMLHGYGQIPSLLTMCRGIQPLCGRTHTCRVSCWDLCPPSSAAWHQVKSGDRSSSVCLIGRWAKCSIAGPKVQAPYSVVRMACNCICTARIWTYRLSLDDLLGPSWAAVTAQEVQSRKDLSFSKVA